MGLIWLTDVHFNFLSKEGRESFYEEITIEFPDIEFLVFCGHTHSKAYPIFSKRLDTGVFTNSTQSFPDIFALQLRNTGLM